MKVTKGHMKASARKPRNTVGKVGAKPVAECPKNEKEKAAPTATKKIGKAGRVYKLTKKGERYYEACKKFLVELEQIEKEK